MCYVWAMRRPGDHFLQQISTEPNPLRPGKVMELRGIVFQSDKRNEIGSGVIRAVETFDRWQAGLVREPGEPPLAMHVGMHVVIEGGAEYVLEQLIGNWFEDFEDGMNWTPLRQFQEREGAGWDATVPATAFRGIGEAEVGRAVSTMNGIVGRPFIAEDCTMLVERVFGGRRLFGDSPTAHNLGFGWRVGDPALPLLRAEAALDERSRRLLRWNTVAGLPDARAAHDAPNARVWSGRAIAWGALLLIATALSRPARAGGRGSLRG
jgi:hypothetical protein